MPTTYNLVTVNGLQSYAANFATTGQLFSGNYNDLANKPDLSIYDELKTYPSQSAFPNNGQNGILYLAEDSGKMYRWNGTGYFSVSGSHSHANKNVLDGITATDVNHWSAAYSWGNHAQAGYVTNETDPVFSSSPAAGISSSDIQSWNALKPAAVKSVTLVGSGGGTPEHVELEVY